MNELQKKLARRRSLNGEQIASLETGGDAEVAPLPPREAKNEARQDLPSSSDGTKNSKASELQSKLARRRDLNGEDSSPSVAVASTVNESSQRSTRIASDPHTEQEKTTELTQSQSRTTSLTEADGPAWLNDFASSVQTMEPFQSRAQSAEVFTIADEVAPEQATSEDTYLKETSNEVDAVALESNQTSEPTDTQEVQAPVPAEEENEEVVPAKGQPDELRMNLEAVSLENDALVEATPVLSPLVETTAAQNSNGIVEAYVPATFDETHLHANLKSDIVDPVDQHLLVAPVEQALHKCMPNEEENSVDPSPVVVVVDKHDSDMTVEACDQSNESEVTAYKAAEKTNEEKEIEPAVTVATFAAVVPASPVVAVQSPSRSRGAWSPLRATATKPALVLPTVDTGSDNSLAYPRSNTTTGSMTPQNQQGGGFSPLRRSTSFTGATPTNPRTPGRKTGWYPGKFLIEGPAGWSSKNATPMIKMNPDQARSHYADLMSSSANDVTTSTTEATRSPTKSALKVKVNHKEMHEEKARAAKISDSMATGSNDDVIDMVLQLSRENGQLKKEVTRLKAQLNKQALLLAAYERGEAPTVSSALAGTAIDDSLDDPEFHTIMAESMKHQHHEEAEKIAARAASFSSSPSSHGSASDSEIVVERAVLPTSEKLSSPTANSINASANVSGSTSANGSAVKARASRRFGARTYYSAYQSEESEDGLFGAEEPIEPIGLNNKYQTLAFEDQYDSLSGTVKPTAASGEVSVDQSLDKLLRSGTLSSSRDSVGRTLVTEKHLVQSFRSTSAVTSKASDLDGTSAEIKRGGDWQQRFGHLGLIATDGTQGAQAEDKQQLFNEEADAKARIRTAANEAREATMEYEEFISKFTKTNELVDMTREFMSSVVGPNGDATPPVGRKKLSYVFYGTHKLDLRCRQFFDHVQELFLTWPEFKDETDERLICARDGIEQYIMQRIAEFAFKSTVDAEGDELLSKRMKLLSFLKPEALDIKPELFNETLLTIAANELRKINGCKTPGDKVACVVKSASVIFRSLSLSRAKSDSEQAASSGGASSTCNQDDNNIAGADDFLPLFIWVVMRSHIPRLCSNVNYVQTYLNPARLMGKWGYCLINLSSAIEFVKYIEADQLIIDPKEFEVKLIEAERELNGGFL